MHIKPLRNFIEEYKNLQNKGAKQVSGWKSFNELRRYFSGKLLFEDKFFYLENIKWYMTAIGIDRYYRKKHP